MELSTNDVLNMGNLARLELTSEELEKYRSQLGSILDYVEILSGQSDTEGSTTLPGKLKNVLRSDEIKDSLSRDEVLKNAPLKQNGFLKVQAVLNHDN